MIIEKAKDLAAFIKTLPGKAGTEMPTFSNGWVSGFTKRHMFVGTALNAPGVTTSSSGSASGSDSLAIPFPTNEQLIQLGRAEDQTLANKDMDVEMETDMLDPEMDSSIMDSDLNQDLASASMNDIVSDMQGDIHSQVVHAVARDMSPANASSTTASTAPPSNSTVVAPEAKKARGRKPRIIMYQPPQQQQQQQQQQNRQMHPAVAGLVSARPRAVDRISSTASSPPTVSRPQISSQTLLQTGSSTNVNTNARDTGAIMQPSIITPAAPTESTELLLAKQKIEETKKIMDAVLIVINSLNDAIPAERDLLRPLFNMERRLREEIFAGERQLS
ncbi:hypothetical protein BGX27_008385 [Mortierella sp. AM989]|nr:hypothetical protein BGX27_008385 [Mortierella sp. AM989]